MKFGRADLRKLRASVLLAVVMIAVGGVALYVALDTKEGAERAKVSIGVQFSEADGKLKQVRDEESEVKQKSIVFNKLQERGIIGDEPRLDWVELLKEIRAAELHDPIALRICSRHERG